MLNKILIDYYIESSLPKNSPLVFVQTIPKGYFKRKELKFSHN